MLLGILNACSKSDGEPYDPYYDPNYEFSVIGTYYRADPNKEYESWGVWHVPDNYTEFPLGYLNTINGLATGLSLMYVPDSKPNKSMDGTWAISSSYRGTYIPHYELVAKFRFKCPVYDNSGYTTGISSDWKYAYGQYEYWIKPNGAMSPIVFRIIELYDEIPE